MSDERPMVWDRNGANWLMVRPPDAAPSWPPRLWVAMGEGGDEQTYRSHVVADTWFTPDAARSFAAQLISAANAADSGRVADPVLEAQQDRARFTRQDGTVIEVMTVGPPVLEAQPEPDAAAAERDGLSSSEFADAWLRSRTKALPEPQQEDTP